MKNNILLFVFAFSVISLSSCYDDHEDYFSDYSLGAIVQVGNLSPGFFDFIEPEDANIAFDVTLQENSSAVDQVIIYKSYNNGVPVEFQSINTFPSNFNVSLAEAAEGLVDFEEIQIGDVFGFTFRSQLNDGRVVTSASSVNAVVSCESEIAGIYDGVASGQSTDGCCPDPVSGIEKEIIITSTGDGTYTLSDFSGGLYFEWYEVYGITEDFNLSINIRDVCNEISIFNSREPFGTDVTGGGSVDPETGVITLNWTNGFDDIGTLVLTPQ